MFIRFILRMIYGCPFTNLLYIFYEHFFQNSNVEEMVASYKRSNQQLAGQVGEQRKQILQLQEKLKEYSAAAQKLSDQKALKEQLEVHIQTIGILVSEKSELQSSIVNIQKKVTTKDAEINDLTNQYKTAQANLLEYEKSVSELKQAEGSLKKVSCLAIS